MVTQEKELYRFVNEPKYRAKVIANIHKEQDALYDKRIRGLRSERQRLLSAREKEISRISQARWESIANGKLLVNTTEGKIKINSTESAFSDILGAEMNAELTYRVTTQSTGQSKRHASLGGAALGGLVTMNPVGAVVGGIALGKTKTKGSSVQDQIPMCAHLGVLVNISGFVTEIVLLTKQVEQTSSDYIKAEREAQTIIAKLSSLAKTPVPTSWLAVENEPSVKEYDEQIVNVDNQIRIAIEDKPTYKIPAMYRTEEQKYMTDDEYLAYLASEDVARVSAKEPKASDVSKDAVSVEPIVVRSCEPKVEEIKSGEHKKEKGASVGKRVFGVIGSVIGWILSVFALIMVLGALISGGIASTILFVVSALSINPLVHRLVKSKVGFIRKWMCVVLFIITFIIGAIVMPTATTDTTQVALMGMLIQL